MTINRVRMAVRALGGVMILLGLTIWTGAADFLIPIHMLIGLLFVVALWAAAYLGMRAGASPVLVGTAVVLGLVLPVFGASQENLLTGSSHWIVQVIHLALGVVAIGTGDAVASVGERAEAV